MSGDADAVAFEEKVKGEEKAFDGAASSGRRLPKFLAFFTLKSVSLLVYVLSAVAFKFYAMERHRLCAEELRLAAKPFRLHAGVSGEAYMLHVVEVLRRMGLRRWSPEDGDGWSLLWSHPYPYVDLREELERVGPHQKINHFPGIHYVTLKVDFCTWSRLRSVPESFYLPGDKRKLLEFAAAHPEARFLRKHIEHRHVRLVALEEVVDAVDDNSTADFFLQRFVERPLLVAGHFFDIGVYTAITSVDPLRIYAFQGDALIRFCHEEYHPFDAENVNKYVIPGDYRPIWNMSAMDVYFKRLDFGRKESLNAFLRAEGRDPDVIWSQIEDNIRDMFLENELWIAKIMNKHPSKRSFFELTRVDFIVDEDMRVYLMEANLSPNMYAPTYPHNRVLYEQLLFNLFGLVGVGERVRRSSFANSPQEVDEMEVADKDLAVFPLECASEVCTGNCTDFQCQFCLPCLTEDRRVSLRQAHREYLNRGSFKRIFPPPMTRESAKLPMKHPDFNYFPENKFHLRWFQGKCLLDETWC